MRKFLIISIVFISLSYSLTVLLADDSQQQSPGESLFNEHCNTCHPNGGNILNPQRSLYPIDLEANNIRTSEDIVNKVRNIGPASVHPQSWLNMRKFDETALSHKDVLKIAEHILKTFR